MTTSQSEAFDDIEKIMREHFSAGILSVLAEERDGEVSAVHTTYHGGQAVTVGLAEIAKKNLLLDDES